MMQHQLTHGSLVHYRAVKLSDWIAHAKGRLEAAGVESPALEAQLLAAHVLLVDRTFVLTHPDHDFPDLAGETLLQRRESQEPLAYILGEREFYGRSFRVAPGVLIPRHETETLVEAALGQSDVTSVLDLGTGSGCIAVTLKLERPEWDVTGVDVSEGALEIATANAARLGAQVRFICSDGFEGLLGESFDLIVTNPPYIGLHEALAPEVRDFEPSEALFAGHTGLEFYERLAVEAADYLRDGGLLMMEVGYRQAREVTAVFEAQGWNLVEIRQDLSCVERVVVVQPIFACAT